jgi:hypothetical protein
LKSSTFIRPVVFAALAVLFSTTTLWALGPEAHTTEISVGGGYTHLNPDPNDSTTSANHGLFGVSASYNITKVFSIGGEYTFTSLASEKIDNISANVHLHNYGALLHFGLFNFHVAQPYFLIDGGSLNLRGNATSGNQSAHEDHYGGYLGAGFGVNAYLGHGLGIRPEIRYSRQQLNDTRDNEGIFPGNGRNEVTATGQIFYTFGRHSR